MFGALCGKFAGRVPMMCMVCRSSAAVILVLRIVSADFLTSRQHLDHANKQKPIHGWYKGSNPRCENVRFQPDFQAKPVARGEGEKAGSHRSLC